MVVVGQLLFRRKSKIKNTYSFFKSNQTEMLMDYEQDFSSPSGVKHLPLFSSRVTKSLRNGKNESLEGQGRLRGCVEM